MKQATQASRASRYPLGVARPIARSVSRWLTVSIFAAVLAVSLHAQTSKVNAGQVQAAYLYNFGKFVKWPAVAPANQSGAFIICVLDQDPFGDTLQSTLSGETVAGKPVAVRRLTKPQDASACHILFISGSRAHELNQILSSIDEAAVLTVSDMPDFSKRGGMIQFVLEGDRIRFEINLAGAEKSHLVFPSELLKVATAVRKPARSGD
jgi:hypothetical protein